MKAGLLLIITVTIASLAIYHLNTQQKNDIFQEWMEIHKVTFETSAQKFYRRSIFYQNYRKINQHNSKEGETYKMGINQFAIYSQQQFVQKFLNVKYSKIDSNHDDLKKNQQINAVIVDWVEKGAVGPVKNQGTCGSAVLYSTIGGIEGLSKVTTGTLQIFSQQQLIDCVFGCAGSQASLGYNYYKTHGACTAAEYPNTGKVGTCQNKPCSFKISDVKTVNNCDALVNALMIEPISVTVDASKWSVYASGIFSNCGNALNHMVLLVGMADEYWKCKNSWGTSWGERGYIRLARGDTCGICQYGSYPIK